MSWVRWKLPTCRLGGSFTLYSRPFPSYRVAVEWAELTSSRSASAQKSWLGGSGAAPGILSAAPCRRAEGRLGEGRLPTACVMHFDKEPVNARAPNQSDPAHPVLACSGSDRG